MTSSNPDAELSPRAAKLKARIGEIVRAARPDNTSSPEHIEAVQDWVESWTPRYKDAKGRAMTREQLDHLSKGLKLFDRLSGWWKSMPLDGRMELEDRASEHGATGSSHRVVRCECGIAIPVNMVRYWPTVVYDGTTMMADLEALSSAAPLWFATAIPPIAEISESEPDVVQGSKVRAIRMSDVKKAAAVEAGELFHKITGSRPTRSSSKTTPTLFVCFLGSLMSEAFGTTQNDDECAKHASEQFRQRHSST